MTINNIHVHSVVFTCLFTYHIEFDQSGCAFIQINHNQSSVFPSHNVKINSSIFLGNFHYSKCHHCIVHIEVVITKVSYINKVTVWNQYSCQCCDTINHFNISHSIANSQFHKSCSVFINVNS